MKPHGIIVFGANGSGKTTLGRELARILNFRHMDHEAYAFRESEIPYTDPRSRDECIALLLADIEKHRNFVLSAVTGDFGEEITRYYELAVWITAPKELRMERVARRAREKHGDRVLPGGDMHERQAEFLHFAANRNLTSIDRWAETLTCPIVRIDGTADWRAGARRIQEEYYEHSFTNHPGGL